MLIHRSLLVARGDGEGRTNLYFYDEHFISIYIYSLLYTAAMHYPLECYSYYDIRFRICVTVSTHYYFTHLCIIKNNWYGDIMRHDNMFIPHPHHRDWRVYAPP